MHARLENDSCVTRRRASLKYTGFTCLLLADPREREGEKRGGGKKLLSRI